jgi:hypothetical protein
MSAGRTGGRASRRRLIAAKRAQEAMSLRIQGHTYQEIAARLDYADESGARAVIRRQLEQAREQAAELTEDLRALEGARLDALSVGLWAGFSGPDRSDDPDLRRKLAEALVRLSARRSALLGLDAPRRTELAGPAGQRLLDLPRAMLLAVEDEPPTPGDTGCI